MHETSRIRGARNTIRKGSCLLLNNGALFNRFPCSSLRDESVRERGESGGKLRGKGAGGNSEVESKVSGEGGSCVRTCAIGKTVRRDVSASARSLFRSPVAYMRIPIPVFIPFPVPGFRFSFRTGSPPKG